MGSVARDERPQAVVLLVAGDAHVRVQGRATFTLRGTRNASQRRTR